MKKICLLGASGSIGTQTLDVIKANPNDFELVSFSVGNKVNKISQILANNPSVTHICVKDETHINKLMKKHPNVQFCSGDEGLNEIINNSECDMVVNALVGFVGLKPTLTALSNDKIVALANKEALVVGGELVNRLLDEGHGKLYPIDSEHVAIAKCLSVDSKNVEKIILTASGGAFRYISRELLALVKPEKALEHPTWKMGPKITIDCATMINKCFEVIEAHYLFHYPVKKIDILLHDESMIHSMVLYKNQTYRLEHSKPDMRVPIKWALYEGVTDFQTISTDNYKKVGNYHYRKFTFERYPLVKWAKTVINNKGTYGACLNASNEIAVQYFLEKQIPFLAIENIVNKCMRCHKNIINPTYEDLLRVDLETRLKALKLIEKGDY